MIDAIAQAVAELRSSLSLPVDVTRRGPVRLESFFEELALPHVALPRLTCGVVAEYLAQQRIDVGPLGNPTEDLAGFIVVAGNTGLAFVNASDILPRRRFTAAHELGHFVLHRAELGPFQADTPASIAEAAEGPAVLQREREANRFAAEILMPREVCEARADQLRRDHGVCPRAILAYRLAAELLVSREAMRYRLQSLEVGDE